MDNNFEVFDFQRIFIGDLPMMFLLEIVFRTVIMYLYTIFLLRILGKRGIGQLSTLELAIIISFGSAVGDPMVGSDIPILHGIVAITVVAGIQIAMEYIINRNKKLEIIMEGAARPVVDNGIIILDWLRKENLSKEDLFRSLRGKEVEHLGQIKMAYFEVSGQISVLFHPPKNIKPGLTVTPENELPKDAIIRPHMMVHEDGVYCCINCGASCAFTKNQVASQCRGCMHEEWIKAIDQPKAE